MLVDDTRVRNLDDEVGETTLEQWASGALLVALVRSVSGGGYLGEQDVEKVLVRMGPDGPFSITDLPY